MTLRLPALLLASAIFLTAQTPVRIAVAGLVHGHVSGFFRLLKTHPEVELAGIYDPDTTLHAKYQKQFNLSPTLFYTSLDTMLDSTHPQAVATFTSTAGHPAIVQALAKRHIHTMMEKPMAVDNDAALRIREAATAGNIQVVINYETTWYATHRAIWYLMKEQNAGGQIRKIVAMDGHQGPKAINVPTEFFAWLTDPQTNGAGALFDFGCYGANLMTWLMDNKRPTAVTATSQHFQPTVYPKVEDEATVLVEYPGTIGIIQGSWNWPFARKDLEVYAEKAYAVATGPTVFHQRLPGKPEQTFTPTPMPADEADSVAYLVSVVRGQRKPEGLSSLANNMIVVEILSAARQSAATGKRVTLPPVN